MDCLLTWFGPQYAALAYRETDLERRSLLATYGEERLIQILAAFGSAMKERVTYRDGQHMTKEERLQALCGILMSEGTLTTLRISSFVSAACWTKLCDLKKKGLSDLKKVILSKKVAAAPAKNISTYFKLRANQSLHRQNNTKDLITQQARDTLSNHLFHLYETDGNCKLCSIPLTVYGTWSNASPDRIVPGCKGGKYTPENTRLLCVACNLVKSFHSDDAAKVLLDTLSSASWMQKKWCSSGQISSGCQSY
jgi:hypothetical protein